MLIKDHTHNTYEHTENRRPEKGRGDDVKDGTEKGNHISYKVDY